MVDIIETVYRGASKGRGLVVAPKGKFRLCYSFLANCECLVGQLTYVRLLDQAQVLVNVTQPNMRGHAPFPLKKECSKERKGINPSMKRKML